MSNAISTLPVFKHYDIDDVLHSSSDGQKFETRIPILNARHSPKYFGLKKGVVAYTLLANHVPINAEIIGANEHESHYVFDILFNNTTDIQPEVHSTDTHGTNEVNSPSSMSSGISSHRAIGISMIRSAQPSTDASIQARTMRAGCSSPYAFGGYAKIPTMNTYPEHTPNTSAHDGIYCPRPRIGKR